MTTSWHVGTSLTESWNGSTNTFAFPTTIAAREGWTPTIDGWGGSGFGVRGQAGAGQGTFMERLAALLAAHPDVVVVEGGANDGPSTPTLLAAIHDYLAALRAGLPSATIYVTAAWQRYGDVQAYMALEAKAIGAAYVSSDGWLTGTGDTTHLIGDGNRDVYAQSWPHLSTPGYVYAGMMFAFAISPPSTGLAGGF